MSDNGWEKYAAQAEKGPKAASKLVIKGFLLLFGIGIIFSIVGYIGGWFSEAAQIAKQEFGPKAMLTKYEWFKDQSAGLDKSQADIQVYSVRLSVFSDMERKDMDQIDKQQQAQILAEVAGVKANYNGMAADWNSQISKFHWKPFIGDLPPGAEILLTKEYAPYEMH